MTQATTAADLNAADLDASGATTADISATATPATAATAIPADAPTATQAPSALQPVIIVSPDIAGGAAMFAGTDVPVAALFDALARNEPLDAFLRAHPAVDADQAHRALHMSRALLEAYAYGDPARLDFLCGGEADSSPIHSHKDIMAGTPVFKGTRMIARNLFDYLGIDCSIDGFLASFDTFVTREQAAKAIRMAGKALENYADETAD